MNVVSREITFDDKPNTKESNEYVYYDNDFEVHIYRVKGKKDQTDYTSIGIWKEQIRYWLGAYNDYISDTNEILDQAQLIIKTLDFENRHHSMTESYKKLNNKIIYSYIIP